MYHRLDILPLKTANNKVSAGYVFLGNHKPENNQYFYHSDHLGSTSYVTDRQGNAEQFVVYMPYGEVLTEEHGNWTTPYLFNGKELDIETGLYYYGARYYDPKISIWYGVDPMTEKYPNLSSYNYCGSNPVRLIDPTGMDAEESTDPPPSISLPPSFRERVLYDGEPSQNGSSDNQSPSSPISTTPSANNRKTSVSNTTTQKIEKSVPQNPYFEASAHASTAEGNAGLLNVDSRATTTIEGISPTVTVTQTASSSYQVNTPLVGAGVEVGASSNVSKNAGISLRTLGVIDIGASISLSPDIINSSLSVSLGVTWGNKSYGVSAGIKPITAVAATIVAIITRLCPIILTEPALITPPPITTKSSL